MATLDPIYQGADYAYDLAISENGTALDLTGATLSAQLRKAASSTDVLASFVSSIPTQSGSLVGSASLSLAASVTATIPASTGDGWAHDAFLHLPDGRTLDIVPLTPIPVIARVTRP
jgi:hypothetical protein